MREICVVDFCGTYHPSGLPGQYWADWDPATKLVAFGGDWKGIPAMFSETEPSEAAVYAYADKHLAAVQ